MEKLKALICKSNIIMISLCVFVFAFFVRFIFVNTQQETNKETAYYYEVLSPGVGDLREQALHFSHLAGLYAYPFYLEITLEREREATNIFFTLDGSNPTPESSYLFTSPLLITDRTPELNVLSAIPGYRIGCFLVYYLDYFIPPEGPVFKATVIRAQAFDQYHQAVTDIVTMSYFVSDDIFTRYTGLPIISLATDASNFFDDEIGIYVRGHNDTGGHEPDDPEPNWRQRGREWERPIHFEMFEVDGDRVVAMDMGVRIHGGGTRRLAQKSLRLYARSYYDPLQPTLRHDVFNGAAVDVFGEPIVEFNRLLLRNFGNEGTATMIRDAGLQYLSRYLNVDFQASRPAVVFLNGEFWGMYYIMERLDARYLASHYHVSRHDVAILSKSPGIGAVLDEGSEADLEDFRMLEYFLYNNSFYDNDMYLHVQRYIDIDSFIDHYIIQIYLGNMDWPGNNMRVWRYNGVSDTDIPALDGRWRWMLFDLCSTTGFSFGFNYYEDNLIRLIYLPDDRERIPGETYALPNSTLMFRRLIENEDFRIKFVNRFKDVMDTYFTADLFLDMVDSFSEEIRHVVPEQIERYGRIESMEAWEEELDILRAFGIYRREYMLKILEQNLELNNQ